tara:strand:- start:298 stop:1233 length:936 start_codon:yes stop_codon:yes gene_type:complete
MSDISLENLNSILQYNFDSEFDGWAGRTNDMSKVDIESIHKNLNSQKKKLNYKDNNIDYQKQLGEAVDYISDLKGKYDDIVMMKDEVVQINNTPELQGNNWTNFKMSKAGQDIAKIVGGKVSARMENDILGYDVDGVFMSTFDIRKMVNNTTLDKSSKDILDAMVEYYKTQAQKQGAGDLNIEEARGKIDSEIVSKGNMQSLKYDKIIETKGGNFIQDFTNNLQSMSRKDLGITQGNEKGSEKDMLSLEEATIITNEMQKDKNLEKEQLIDYFTAHVFEQYENERRQNPSSIYRNTQQDTPRVEDYTQGSL